MDRLNQKILELLQADSTRSITKIAEQIGLSKGPCCRRIRRLRETGVIKKTVALVDAAKINVGTTAIVALKARDHTAEWYDRFARAVAEIPEVTEIYRMSGDIDYLLRIVVPDIAGYDCVYKKLINAVEFLDVNASFVLETIKHTTALPLSYARRKQGCSRVRHQSG